MVNPTANHPIHQAFGDIIPVLGLYHGIPNVINLKLGDGDGVNPICDLHLRSGDPARQPGTFDPG